MTDWIEFIERQGAMATHVDSDSVDAGFVAPLNDLGLIAFSGADAGNFLHNQLTNDVEHLGLTEARLAGYCSPKGRLLASFLMWRSDQSIVLQVDRAIQPAIQKRLQMFVLRAKVTIADVTNSFAMLGLGGSLAAAAMSRWFPVLPEAIHAKVDSASGTLIRVADANGMARYQWITTPEIAIGAWTALREQLSMASADYWRLTEIRAAIAHITLATQEKFVPQMINLEAVGGVNFKKGCYPGQEIVARSQYLGKLKRRMLPATVTTTHVAAGMEVFTSGDTLQPCGMIVNAAHDRDGVAHCLVEIKTAVLDVDGETVHLGPSGPRLQFTSLPYALPDAI